MAHRDRHHRSQDDLVLFRLTPKPLGDKVFEMAIEFTGSPLPYLQVAERVLDFDRARVRALVGRDVDLAPVVLDVSFGVIGIGFEFHQQLRGELDQLRCPGDPGAPVLLTEIAHGLGQTITSVVGTGSRTFDLLRTRAP